MAFDAKITYCIIEHGFRATSSTGILAAGHLHPALHRRWDLDSAATATTHCLWGRLVLVRYYDDLLLR